MIKTAIKHVIYEVCIGIFFSNIDKNFRRIKKTDNEIKKAILSTIRKRRSAINELLLMKVMGQDVEGEIIHWICQEHGVISEEDRMRWVVIWNNMTGEVRREINGD